MNTALSASGTELDALYAEHIAYLWDFLKYLGVVASDIEDAAHDAFVVLFRRLPEYDTSRPVRPWLAGIAAKVASEYRRKYRKRPALVVDAGPPQACDASPEDLVRVKQAQQILMAALEHLSPERREVFVLHDVEQYSVTEIAEMLEVPLNTLYSRLRRARLQFNKAIARSMGGGGP